MKYYQMQDTDINDVMSMAMNATLSALVSEKLLTDAQAVVFRDTHVCLKVDDKSIWRWIKKKFKLEAEDDSYWAVVFTVPSVKEEPKNEPLV